MVLKASPKTPGLKKGFAYNLASPSAAALSTLALTFGSLKSSTILGIGFKFFGISKEYFLVLKFSLKTF